MARGAFERLRAAAPTISVGVLTADLAHRGDEVAVLERAGVPLVHFDVMDGRFAPMMTIGPRVVGAVATSLLKDVHLMIEEPLAHLDDFVQAGADVVTVHVEACRHPHRALQALGAMTNANDPGRGIVRGLALNPGTALAAVGPLLDEIDLLLVLAVNPGWGGQRFIAATAGRLAEARRMIASCGRDVLLGVDGGVKRDNVAAIAAMGVDVVVTGSAVFDGAAAEENARAMLSALRSAA